MKRIKRTIILMSKGILFYSWATYVVILVLSIDDFMYNVDGLFTRIIIISVIAFILRAIISGEEIRKILLETHLEKYLGYIEEK